MNKEKIDISFIIATYNGEKFLKYTIESVLSQENVNIEVVIIDDCSTDFSYEVANDYEKKYNKIKCIRNKKNLGFCASVNIALNYCKGNYISILGQDDIICNMHCYKMLKLAKKGVALIFCDHVLIDDKGVIFNRDNHCLHREITINDLATSNKIPAPGLIISKESLVKVGGYPEFPLYKNYGEYYTWSNILQFSRAVYCDDVKAQYRRHSTNMTNSFNNRQQKKDLCNYYWMCQKNIIKCKKTKIMYKLLSIVARLRNLVKAYLI